MATKTKTTPATNGKAEGKEGVTLPGLTLKDRAVIYNRIIVPSKGATLKEKIIVRNLKIAMRPTDEETKRFEIEKFSPLSVDEKHAKDVDSYEVDIHIAEREAEWLRDWFEWMSSLAEDKEVKFGGGLPNDDTFDTMFWKVVEPLSLKLE